MLAVLKKWFNTYLSDERVVIFLLSLITFILVVWTIGDILAPFFAALIIAYILQGVVSFMQRFGCPQLVSVWVVWLLLSGSIFSIFLFLLPAIWVQLSGLIAEWPKMVAEGQSLLLRVATDNPDIFTPDRIQRVLAYLQSELASIGEAVLTYLLARLPGVVILLIYIVLVPILVFFLLRDWPQMATFSSGITSGKGMMLNDIARDMDIQIANYIRGKTIEILVVGIASFIVFSLLGLRYALLLSVLSGISVLIPYVGAFSVALPVAVVALVQWGWSQEFITVMLAYLVLQVLDGNLLVPILFSEAVNLHPVMIILAVLVFGGLWGFWGIFFAIPLATLIKAVIRAWPVYKYDE